MFSFNFSVNQFKEVSLKNFVDNQFIIPEISFVPSEKKSLFSGNLKEITDNINWHVLIPFVFFGSRLNRLLCVVAQRFSGLYPAVICTIGGHHNSIGKA